MTLQVYTLALGNFRDDTSGNNYAANTPVYILNSGGTLADIFRDQAGAQPIVQDGLNNISDAYGEFTFYVNSGQYISRVAGRDRLINVVGSDYFDSRVDDAVEQITQQTLASRGFRVVGTFAGGFTYELFNDVGIDANGNSWIYTGAGAPNKVVETGTVPSVGAGYEQVTFNKIDLSLRKHASLNEAIGEDANEGTLYVITDLDDAHYQVVSAAEVGGWYHVMGSGRKLKHTLKDHYVTFDELQSITAEVTDCLAAYNYAKTLDAILLLQQVYALSDGITFDDDQIVVGLSRETTGFCAIPPFGTLSTRSLTDIGGKNVQLYNFKSDCTDFGDASAGIRYNALSTSSNATGFSVKSVDVYNATGYGHVTFGDENDPQVTGYYEDCKAYNCQVLFEQIGALEVDLYSCKGFATAGRTIESFHPYAGSKKVTYTNCSVTGDGGAGINIVTTLGNDVGPIKFINCSVDIDSTVSAINLATASGAVATIDVEFIGGTYKSSGGASFVASSDIKIKAIGTKFIGPDSFNLPTIASYTADVTLTDCDVLALKDSSTATTNCIVSNGQKPKIIGGSVNAVNNLGDATAILGDADTTSVTLIPTIAGGGPLEVANESAGYKSVIADGPNGYFTIDTAFSMNDVSKIIISIIEYSSTSTYQPTSYNMSWHWLDNQSVRVNLYGLTSGEFNYRLTYLK